MKELQARDIQTRALHVLAMSMRGLWSNGNALCENSSKKQQRQKVASIMIIWRQPSEMPSVAELEAHEERAMFLEDLRLEGGRCCWPHSLKLRLHSLSPLPRACFTAGEKEVLAAWTLPASRLHCCPPGCREFIPHRFSKRSPSSAEVMKIQ